MPMSVARLNTPDLLASHGLFQPDSAILDLGCGSGMLADYLTDSDIACYVGADVRYQALSAIQAKSYPPHFLFLGLNVYNPLYAVLRTGKAEDFTLPFVDSTFSAIVCHSLFTHLERESAVIAYMAELKRLLKPNGFLWTTWFRSPPNQPSDSAIRTVYKDSFIRTQLAGYEVVDEYGGLTDAFHDQWEILARKRP